MDKYYINATFAYIVNTEGKVLLIRRALHDDFPGRWELPGGILDNGEDIEGSIEREVLEEVGITVKAIRPVSVINHKKYDNKEVIRLTYLCVLVNPEEEIRLSNDHDAFRWADHEELHKISKDTPLEGVIDGIREPSLHFPHR